MSATVMLQKGIASALTTDNIVVVPTHIKSTNISGVPTNPKNIRSR